MFRSFGDIHLSDIGSFYWEKWQRYARWRIQSINVNGVWTIVSFTSAVIYVPIRWRHPFIRYRQRLLAQITATCSLLHLENQRQQSGNSFMCRKFHNQGIAQIIVFTMELLTTLIGNNIIYQRQNTNSQLIDIASCKACKNVLLGVEDVILIRYY
jgi:hypothetical protein